MSKTISQLLLALIFLVCSMQVQAQTCSGSLTVMLTGSSTGAATAAPTGSASQTFCSGSKVSDLVATGASGATIKWYAASSGGTALTSTTVLTNATHYFATQTTTADPTCESVSRLDVTATVTPLPAIVLSSATGTDAQTVCKNVAPTNITYAVTNATGATVTGLPTGISGSYSGGVVTISGTTPAATVSGTFNYTVTTTGGCSPAATTTGSITVTPLPAIVLSSAAGTDAQTVCKNVAITNITYAFTDATGVTITGLPVGVNGVYASGIVTISGTPTASGTFNYAVTTSGGCSPAATAGGTISVTATPTLALSSTAGTNAQTVCPNIAIINITYAVSNATGAIVTGLPTGVTGTYSGGVVTISGTPTASGTFTYTVTTSGGCSPPATAMGTITVNPAVVAATCTPVQDACQLGQGQIKVQVSGGTSPYTLTATSKTLAPLSPAGTITPLTSPSADTTTDTGFTDYLFTGLAGNTEYKFKIVDSKGCTVGGTH